VDATQFDENVEGRELAEESASTGNTNEQLN
jgi:hypothetical protein